MTFDNRSMREPVHRKPHIALIDGWWRVSAWKKGTGAAYYEAHAVVLRANERRHGRSEAYKDKGWL